MSSSPSRFSTRSQPFVGGGSGWHVRLGQWLAAISLSATALLAACGGGDASPGVTKPPIEPPIVRVASVTLDRSAATLVQGTATQLVATPRDASGNALTGREITWTTSAPAIATVGSGLVTGVSVGAALITATSEGNSATANVAVTPIPVASVSLSSDRLSLLVGARDSLRATVRAADGSALTGRTVTWTSSNSAVASVANGIVTAVTPGNATISALSEGVSAAAVIDVRALSCASTVPTGRLVRPQAGGAFTYTTLAGWTISIDQNRMRLRAKDSTGIYEFWGSTHESLGGKHIKDLLETRRTLLQGNAMITFDITPRAALTPPQAWVNFISIYDGTETHRIDMQTYQVVASCALERFGEAAERDGESAELREETDGLYFNNLYTQDASSAGVPLGKVFQTVRLGLLYYLIRNRVDDFFDDPRLAAT